MKIKSIARRILIAAILLDCTMRLFAATEGPRDVIASLWQTQDGLPSETVQAFALTPDHYLWIGTLRGLVRFDGYRFLHIDSDDIPALKTDSIFCLTVTRDGSLWIGTEGGGLIRYQNGAFRNFSANDGLTNDVVRAIYEDSAGALWVGTDSGLFKPASVWTRPPSLELRRALRAVAERPAAGLRLHYRLLGQPAGLSTPHDDKTIMLRSR